MKYYSEDLKKFFDTPEECKKAEEDYEKAIIEAEQKRKALELAKENRIKEIEDARKAMKEANNAYYEKIKAYNKDYGAYRTHKEFNSPSDLAEFIDSITKSLFN